MNEPVLPSSDPLVSTPVPTEDLIMDKIEELIQIQTAANDNLVKASANNDLLLSFILAAILFLVGAFTVFALLSKVRS